MSTLIREQADFLQDVCRLIAFASEQGLVVTGGELERKIELQELYTRMGRKDDNGSLHMRKCAIELNIYSMASGSFELVYDYTSLKPLGDYWESLAPRNRWGGNWKNFKDLGHFERDIDRPVEGDADQTALPPQITTEGANEVLSASASLAIARTNASQPLLAPIRQGADNERAVVLLQACLQQLGFVSSIDGRFGPGTAQAVKKFQASKSLMACQASSVRLSSPCPAFMAAKSLPTRHSKA